MRNLWSLFVLVCLGTSAAQSTLFDVVRFGSLAEVRAQVGATANPTSLVDSYGQDLLIYASNSTEDPEVIRYLVSVGFNVNMMTPERWTPLMYAVGFNPVCFVTLTLLQLGADPGVVNSAGQTARDLLADSPNPSCATAELTRLLTPVQQAAPLISPPVAPAPPPQQRACCRYCSSGKACGDSCIARSNTCRRGPGCACNAVAPADPIILGAVARGMRKFELVTETITVPCDAVNVALGGRFGATTL